MIRPTVPSDTASPEEIQRWLEEHLATLWPMALGSLSLRKSPCVRERCPACASGEKHSSYVLYGRIDGRRFALYVPRHLVPRVEQALANGRRLQQLLQEAGWRWVRALKRQPAERSSP